MKHSNFNEMTRNLNYCMTYLFTDRYVNDLLETGYDRQVETVLSYYTSYMKSVTGNKRIGFNFPGTLT